VKIAFQTFTRPVWIAGVVTFQDLLIALRSLGADCPKLALIEWNHSNPEDYDPLRPYMDETIQADFFFKPTSAARPPSSPSVTARVRRRVQRVLSPTIAPPALLKSANTTLRDHGVDCSFSVLIEERSDVSVPLLIWIYDLQHHHLPQLFSLKERKQRDKAIETEATRATRLVTKSQSIQTDLNELFPQFCDKVRHVAWVADIPSEVYATDPFEVVQRYHLPEKFFYLPNQFWVHKNHTAVIQALIELGARNVYPCVVCTGSLIDHRDPEFIGTFFHNLSLENLREQFIVLGTIPRPDVFALMRQSVAVLNPSLFEGFGLSAAEAKSLGKRVLLSDLPSLREQDAPRALYFNPHDAHELADNLEMLWRTIPAGPDLELEAEARRALPHRQREFANSFLNVAREAMEASRRDRLK